MFYRCLKCGNVIDLIDGDIKNVKCCGENLELLKANSIDASVEKHVPFIEVDGDKLKVAVGEIMHPMDEDHFISFIAMVKDNQVTRINLKPNSKPVCIFPYSKGATIYEYCTKHGLWKKEI